VAEAAAQLLPRQPPLLLLVLAEEFVELAVCEAGAVEAGFPKARAWAAPPKPQQESWEVADVFFSVVAAGWPRASTLEQRSVWAVPVACGQFVFAAVAGLPKVAARQV
jgi:hypothetical protein